MNPWKRRFRFLLETINFRFHVSFRGGRYDVFFPSVANEKQHPGIQAPVPLKAPPNIFGLICPYHQFPTKATWLVHLPKKNITLKSHILKVPTNLETTNCNQNAKDKTTQVAARVMLKYAIVRDGLEAFERPTIAGQKRIHGERFPLTTLGCSKLRGTGLLESKESQESYESHGI